MVEVARDLRRLGRGAGGDQAHALDEHDPRVGVAGHVALARVGLEVRAVVGAVRVGELGDPLRRRVLARDPQRQALGVHEVVRTGRADGHQPRGLLGADELHHAVGRVDGQHLRALGATPRRGSPAAARSATRRARALRPPKRETSPVRSLTNVDGLVDDLDRLAVRLLGGLAPDDQAVLGRARPASGPGCRARPRRPAWTA